ncbi:DUF520 family protein [Shigella flexneri]
MTAVNPGSSKLKARQGIESAVQKKIVKLFKRQQAERRQAQIQGEEIRVTGKARDDLQSVMALVRGDLGQRPV